jgi:hypothetical protein
VLDDTVLDDTVLDDSVFDDTVFDDTVPAGPAGPDRIVRRFPGSSAGLMTRA